MEIYQLEIKIALEKGVFKIMNKTLIFDLSEVLIRGLIGVETVISSRTDISAPAVLKALGGIKLRQLCLAEISEIDYFDDIIKHNNWEISIEDLQKIVRENFNVPIPGMPDLIRNLKKDFTLVLHSDHAVEWIDYILQRHSFLQSSFQWIFFSFQLGLLPPAPASFSLVLDSIGKKPDECVFIDDNAHNIEVADSLGIQTAHFTAKTDLESELEKLIC